MLSMVLLSPRRGAFKVCDFSDSPFRIGTTTSRTNKRSKHNYRTSTQYRALAYLVAIATLAGLGLRIGMPVEGKYEGKTPEEWLQETKTWNQRTRDIILRGGIGSVILLYLLTRGGGSVRDHMTAASEMVHMLLHPTRRPISLDRLPETSGLGP